MHGDLQAGPRQETTPLEDLARDGKSSSGFVRFRRFLKLVGGDQQVPDPVRKEWVRGTLQIPLLQHFRPYILIPANL